MIAIDFQNWVYRDQKWLETLKDMGYTNFPITLITVTLTDANFKEFHLLKGENMYDDCAVHKDNFIIK